MYVAASCSFACNLLNVRRRLFDKEFYLLIFSSYLLLMQKLLIVIRQIPGNAFIFQQDQ